MMSVRMKHSNYQNQDHPCQKKQKGSLPVFDKHIYFKDTLYKQSPRSLGKQISSRKYGSKMGGAWQMAESPTETYKKHQRTGLL